jgi:hypothetical protein
MGGPLRAKESLSMRRMTRRSLSAFTAALLLAPMAEMQAAEPGRVSLSAIPSPIIFRGDAVTAYRDPAAIYHDGWFRLFFTLVRIEPERRPLSYTAWSKSRDLAKWSEPAVFTPRDQSLNFSSPGNIIRYGDQCVLCLQTYTTAIVEETLDRLADGLRAGQTLIDTTTGAPPGPLVETPGIREHRVAIRMAPGDGRRVHIGFGLGQGKRPDLRRCPGRGQQRKHLVDRALRAGPMSNAPLVEHGSCRDWPGERRRAVAAETAWERETADVGLEILGMIGTAGPRAECPLDWLAEPAC